MPFRVPRPAPLRAVLLAAALAAAGCSAPEGHHPAAERPSATAKPSARPPLSAPQLKAVTFGRGEVPNIYESDTMSVAVRTPATGSPQFPPASVPACQTVSDVMVGLRAVAVVDQTFNWKESIWPGDVVLASYQDGAAEQAFHELRTALGSCHRYDFWGYTGKASAEVVAEPDPRVGDEAVSYRRLTSSAKDRDVMNQQIVVVRAGNTTATFVTEDMDRAPSSFPPELIGKQVQRLLDAQRR